MKVPTVAPQSCEWAAPPKAVRKHKLHERCGREPSQVSVAEAVAHHVDWSRFDVVVGTTTTPATPSCAGREMRPSSQFSCFQISATFAARASLFIVCTLCVCLCTQRAGRRRGLSRQVVWVGVLKAPESSPLPTVSIAKVPLKVCIREIVIKIHVSIRTRRCRHSVLISVCVRTLGQVDECATVPNLQCNRNGFLTLILLLPLLPPTCSSAQFPRSAPCGQTPAPCLGGRCWNPKAWC